MLNIAIGERYDMVPAYLLKKIASRTACLIKKLNELKTANGEFRFDDAKPLFYFNCLSGMIEWLIISNQRLLWEVIIHAYVNWPRRLCWCSSL